MKTGFKKFAHNLLFVCYNFIDNRIEISNSWLC